MKAPAEAAAAAVAAVAAAVLALVLVFAGGPGARQAALVPKPGLAMNSSELVCLFEDEGSLRLEEGNEGGGGV
eukprot:SAG22_NODE_9938_length_562_cov_1.248380_1_plen_72_part_10